MDELTERDVKELVVALSILAVCFTIVLCLLLTVFWEYRLEVLGLFALYVIVKLETALPEHFKFLFSSRRREPPQPKEAHDELEQVEIQVERGKQHTLIVIGRRHPNE